ncbi:MAG: hypothetical protein AAF215_05440 [Cyanobacteria bacterium P01_A01_bin.123]
MGETIVNQIQAGRRYAAVASQFGLEPNEGSLNALIAAATEFKAANEATGSKEKSQQTLRSSDERQTLQAIADEFQQRWGHVVEELLVEASVCQD